MTLRRSDFIAASSCVYFLFHFSNVCSLLKSLNLPGKHICCFSVVLIISLRSRIWYVWRSFHSTRSKFDCVHISIADVVGRRPVMLVGLVGMGVSTLLFGL